MSIAAAFHVKPVTVMADTHTDRPLARGRAPIAGSLECWRCHDPVDVDGYCSSCGAVTIWQPMPDELADHLDAIGHPDAQLVWCGEPMAMPTLRRAAAVADGCEVHEQA